MTITRRGQNPTTVISMTPVQAKFIRITQTGTQNPFGWAIQRIRIVAIQ